jgi:hypothetical protein
LAKFYSAKNKQDLKLIAEQEEKLEAKKKSLDQMKLDLQQKIKQASR